MRSLLKQEEHKSIQRIKFFSLQASSKLQKCSNPMKRFANNKFTFATLEWKWEGFGAFDK